MRCVWTASVGDQVRSVRVVVISIAEVVHWWVGLGDDDIERVAVWKSRFEEGARLSWLRSVVVLLQTCQSCTDR